MQIHDVKRNTKNKKHKQLGRGGRHGKTSGRGGKGLTARAGAKKRPAMKEVIKRIPKLRGYRFKTIQIPFVPVNLDLLEKAFSNGEVVTQASLLEKGVVRTKNGKTLAAKILGKGTLTKKIKVSGLAVSEAAKASIVKAGGEVLE